MGWRWSVLYVNYILLLRYESTGTQCTALARGQYSIMQSLNIGVTSMG